MKKFYIASFEITKEYLKLPTEEESGYCRDGSTFYQTIVGCLNIDVTMHLQGSGDFGDYVNPDGTANVQKLGKDILEGTLKIVGRNG